MSRGTQIQKLFYDILMESQYWPAERLRDLQRTHLARLLRHARDGVPFYKERLETLFDVSGEIDWDRWETLPIVTRDDLLVHRDSMQSRYLAPSHGKISYGLSTGSTGTPIRVSRTAYVEAAQAGAVFRGHHWHGVDWQRSILFIVGQDPRIAALPDGALDAPWGPSWSDHSGRALRINPFGRPDQILDFLERHPVGYLACRPKLAQGLALEAIRLGRHVEIDSIITFGTGVTEDEIDDCRQAFGARMFGPYGSTEAQMIAYRCPTSGQYHLNEELVFTEIVDDQGHAVPRGRSGRVVVTPIFNFAQPLVRYDQGDLAIAGDSCTCGRTLRPITRIVGRATQLFKFPDGQHIAPQIPGSLRAALGAVYWQLAQIGHLEIEVRYVSFSDASPNLEAAAQIVREAIRPDITVTFSRRDDLHRLAGGKFMDYVYEVGGGAAIGT